jgi:hypothetical protein
MDAFGERPRRKLVATSETVRKRSPEKRKVLTKLGIRDSRASVQTLVRGPVAHWSRVGAPLALV